MYQSNLKTGLLRSRLSTSIQVLFVFAGQSIFRWWLPFFHEEYCYDIYCLSMKLPNFVSWKRTNQIKEWFHQKMIMIWTQIFTHKIDLWVTVAMTNAHHELLSGPALILYSEDRGNSSSSWAGLSDNCTKSQ